MRSFNLAEAVRKIPAELEDILVRGAYLEHSARTLECSHREQTIRLETMRASQPPFLFLRPKETRAAFEAATRNTSADLTAIDEALSVNKRLSDILRSRSEELLENWLRTHCEEYKLGLAATAFAAKWEAAITRSMEAAEVFVRALGTARNMAPAGYDHERGAFSASTYEAIKAAHAAALDVEASITASNEIAQEHDRVLARTIFNDPMPRLVQEPYASVVGQIASLSAAAAHAEFNRVIAAAEDLINRELAIARARMAEANEQREARMQSYVRNAWNLLHSHAVEHSVEPEHIGAVVEQTERSFLAESLLVAS